jgi:hypothetical protein
MKITTRSALSLLTLAALLSAPAAVAEEGMWLFNMPPTEQLKEQHGFEPSQAFLDHARLSSVRFNNGGSGSFVSAEGLVMTNQHVGRDCIQKLTTAERDLMRDGFIAGDKGAELKCPDLELNQTIDISDVTEQVLAAAQDVASRIKVANPAELLAAKNKAKKAKMSEIEKGCADEAAQIRCDVVTLYSGGAYHLYKYQKYTDVRLVWAPENDAKHFGGEKDNFNFPRMSLDVSFFRVWKNDAPLDSSSHHFAWAEEGAQDGQLVFVSGHPGSTGRLSTPAELTFLREHSYPFLVDVFTERKHAFRAYMDQSEEGRRVAIADWLRAANAQKALTGYLNGLRDDELIAEVRARHADVRGRLAALPEARRNHLLEAWPMIEKAYADVGPVFGQYVTLESYAGPNSTLVNIARHLVRLGDELPKADGERMREYRDAGLPSLKMQLFSEAPVDDGLEQLKIKIGLERMIKVFGAKDPMVLAALGGKTPQARAAELIAGTKLKSIEARQQLFDGGKAAVDASTDPLIAFVKTYDAAGRALRTKMEDGLEATKREVSGRVAEAWAEAYGTTVYPDATFTLRLSYGTVQGYDDDGAKVPWATQIGDLYRTNKRAGNKDPYQLPQRFFDHVSDVDFSVPYNFVSTNDIIGGNSGSPIFNQEGKLVGIIFDGNLPQLSNRFLYRSDTERSVSVHAAGILHVLERVYEADGLVKEITAGGAS